MDFPAAVFGGFVGSILTILLAWLRSLFAGLIRVQVANCRGERMALRKRGKSPGPLDDQVKSWVKEAQRWERSVPRLLRWLPIGGARRIQDLDRVPVRRAPRGTDAERIQRVQNLSGTIQRLDSLRERHEPKF